MTPKQNYHKGFTSIDKLLKNSAKEYHLEGALYRHRTLKQWERVAPGFIEDAENLTKAIDFKKGILTIACLTREAAYQVKIMAERLIMALNQILGKQLIYAIYIEV